MFAFIACYGALICMIQQLILYVHNKERSDKLNVQVDLNLCLANNSFSLFCNSNSLMTTSNVNMFMYKVIYFRHLKLKAARIIGGYTCNKMAKSNDQNID